MVSSSMRLRAVMSGTPCSMPRPVSRSSIVNPRPGGDCGVEIDEKTVIHWRASSRELAAPLLPSRQTDPPSTRRMSANRSAGSGKSTQSPSGERVEKRTPKPKSRRRLAFPRVISCGKQYLCNSQLCSIFTDHLIWLTLVRGDTRRRHKA